MLELTAALLPRCHERSATESEPALRSEAALAAIKRAARKGPPESVFSLERWRVFTGPPAHGPAWGGLSRPRPD